MAKKADGKKKEAAQDGSGEKREVKVVYYDDNSTVADMSGTRGGDKRPRIRSTWREKARTFFGVMKRMFLPMLCTLAAFTILWILLLAVTGNL